MEVPKKAIHDLAIFLSLSWVVLARPFVGGKESIVGNVQDKTRRQNDETKTGSFELEKIAGFIVAALKAGVKSRRKSPKEDVGFIKVRAVDDVRIGRTGYPSGIIGCFLTVCWIESRIVGKEEFCSRVWRVVQRGREKSRQYISKVDWIELGMCNHIKGAQKIVNKVVGAHWQKINIKNQRKRSERE